jgi:hypothetical protein
MRHRLAKEIGWREQTRTARAVFSPVRWKVGCKVSWKVNSDFDLAAGEQHGIYFAFKQSDFAL